MTFDVVFIGTDNTVGSYSYPTREEAEAAEKVLRKRPRLIVLGIREV